MTDEKLGGALPPARKRLVDTPMRKAVRELHQHWQPLWGGNQETPPFAEMRAAMQYDDTSFDTRARTYNIPEAAPTGRGALADHRETSHYVGKRSIHLSRACTEGGQQTRTFTISLQTCTWRVTCARVPLGGSNGSRTSSSEICRPSSKWWILGRSDSRRSEYRS